MRFQLLLCLLSVVWSVSVAAEGSPKRENKPIAAFGKHEKACVSKLQLNIYLAVELTMVDNISNYKILMNDFLKLFPEGFKLGENFNPTDTCSFDESKFKDSSLLAGWTFYDTVLGGGTSSFCPTNYNLMQTSVMNSNSKKPTPNWNRLISYINFYLNYNCSCTRVDDPTTTNYVIWMPLTDTTAETAANITNTKWEHYVVPFFDVQPGGFYDALLKSNVAKNPEKVYNNFLLNRADSYGSAKNLVQELYTRICSDMGVPDADHMSAPLVAVADVGGSTNL